MEFAVDQALKIYSGGLGFLAGSHMKSAFALNQNLIGVGMLWKYGYYDQDRKQDNCMEVEFREKIYHFLVDTKIRVSLEIAGKTVWVAAYYLAPEIFNTAPLFLLTTDIEGNDFETRDISYTLYDSDAATKVAQCMVLGIGGAKVLDALGYTPKVYHFNEAHALSAAFYLSQKGLNREQLKQQLVFTTHTPEEAGNEKHDSQFLYHLGFFAGLSLDEVRSLTGIQDSIFNHTLAALRVSRKANGVSRLHGEVSRLMWGNFEDICEITHITNAQNKTYWADYQLEESRKKNDYPAIASRKKELKKVLFKTVADQCGKLFDPEILTIVWARRFAGYKRADMLTWDTERFDKLLRNSRYPIQLIWAGKPYPKDETAIQTFNKLHYISHLHSNMAVLTGYELGLSKLLKDGSDVWLNTPVVTREASGTSGMTAAMNASLNCSTFDGWICEFARANENAFLIPIAQGNNVNQEDMEQLFDLLENQILPMYYDQPDAWAKMVLTSMHEVGDYFNSDRMATEYYEKLY
ncbi:alpha-glucan family phosphorylase [Arundinibacter roseus]|uniref:Alpha-glucan family phosphorylase n=2 Tax=Arundinibacter roseus TaxID=2070510 RepID=A0A4R4JS54_9BACT|nr:alpha-glucan family phosphorylase [Arundinibacter roseus]